MQELVKFNLKTKIAASTYNLQNRRISLTFAKSLRLRGIRLQLRIPEALAVGWTVELWKSLPEWGKWSAYFNFE